MDVISFGSHYIEIALLLRESLLINGMMTNAEIWYNFSDSEVKEFEALDKMFLRKVLGTPGSTPSEALYLELGILPISVIVKARRVNYLHSILSRDEKGMLYSFFITQWYNPTKGDWTEQVKSDLSDLDLPCSFEYMKSKSKKAFKKTVKRKATEYALKVLLKKKSSHSKMEKLNYKELKLQEYLKDGNLSQAEMKTTFRYRTRMENFGENYRGGRSQVVCPLCGTHLDNQQLSMQCPVIKKNVTVKGDMADIYKEDINIETIKTISKISEFRKEIENK